MRFTKRTAAFGVAAAFAAWGAVNGGQAAAVYGADQMPDLGGWLAIVGPWLGAIVSAVIGYVVPGAQLSPLAAAGLKLLAEVVQAGGLKALNVTPVLANGEEGTPIVIPLEGLGPQDGKPDIDAIRDEILDRIKDRLTPDVGPQK